ncbi:dihydroxyacetone kinase phosphoryl donor subunit DhaM [Clostridium thailandense]|uniref:dihydroxyacetone kinase phosphoryl donor subunit DhaM n=1 Tax=Clostridium thailandense TaxID=2794346 RepID=UPI003989C1C6
MVGLVIISHSAKLAEGVKELAGQMVPEVAIAAAGGTEFETLGTDMQKISQAVFDVYSDDGVIMLFDLGSAFMNAEMAREYLPEHMKNKVHIVDVALAEGAVSAAVDCSLEKSIEEIKDNLKTMCLGKMP